MTKPTPSGVVMYDSPEAAQRVTVTGWRDRHGHFYGDNENLARYSGSTHTRCEMCSGVKETRGYCRPCHAKTVRERWLKFPLVEWDGTGMICVFDDDRYFSSAEEFYEWCAEDDITPEDVMLVTCVKQGMSEISSDHWVEELAEDQELPGAMAEALRALNKIIREREPLTYWPGDKRVILKREIISSEDADS